MTLPKCERCGGSLVRHFEGADIEVRCILCSRVAGRYHPPLEAKPRREPGSAARQVVELCYGRGVSTADAARIVGVSRRSAERYLQEAAARRRSEDAQASLTA